MGHPPHTEADRQAAADQATQWLLRLDHRDCSDAERAAFERWRLADPLHDRAYRDVERLWREAGAVVRNNPAVKQAAQRTLLKRAVPAPAHRRWWPAAAFGMVAAIAVVAFLRWPYGPEVPPVGIRHATATGEQRTVVLQDGSSLTLDTRTVLVERYSPRERRVDLQQGQAQFTVQGDPARPFVVHAQGGTVTAVGTRFQVRLLEAGATVTLLEGKVRVAAQPASGPERQVALAPGQGLRFGADGALGDIVPADLKAVEAWTEGKLYVDGWRLQDFVDELNRYSDTRLRIDDPDLREFRISGVFQTRTRDNLGWLLAEGWGIQSRQVGPGEVLLTRQ